MTDPASAAAAPAAPDPNSFDLESPITRGEQKIEHLSIRKPDAGTMRGLKMTDVLQMDVNSLAVLLPRITTPTLTTADVIAMDPADLMQAGAIVSIFFMTKADKIANGLIESKTPSQTLQ